MLIVVAAVPLPPGFAVAVAVAAAAVAAAAVAAAVVAAAFSSYQMVAEAIQKTSCEQHYAKWFE